MPRWDYRCSIALWKLAEDFRKASSLHVVGHVQAGCRERHTMPTNTTFNVSDKVKAIFKKASLEAYQNLKIDFKQGSSQLANALAAASTLKQLGLLAKDADIKVVLEVAYVGGNTSQARQALLPSQKAEQTANVAAELLAMVK